MQDFMQGDGQAPWQGSEHSFGHGIGQGIALADMPADLLQEPLSQAPATLTMAPSAKTTNTSATRRCFVVITFSFFRIGARSYPTPPRDGIKRDDPRISNQKKTDLSADFAPR